MTRLLFIIESLFPLGPAQQLAQLVHQLSQKSLEIHLAVLDDRNLEAWKTDFDCKIHTLGNSPIQHPFSRTSLRSTYRLRQLITELNPDIVHSWCGPSALVTLAASQFPVSKSGNVPRRFYTELYLQPEKRFLRQLYENELSPGFEATIVPHESARKHFIENGFDGRIEVVPNQIDGLLTGPTQLARESNQRWLRERMKLPLESKIAGTVAPLIARTRLKDLIWATDQLTCVGQDLHFVILGSGVQKSRLRRFASLTEAEQHIHFLDEPVDARRFFASLDFYWHSHLIEPIPINLLSAMAQGIPAISVYGPGTKEIVRHQETGFAVNFGARDEFARWTKYLIEIPAAARQIAQQGQSFVNEMPGISRLATAYLRIYGIEESLDHRTAEPHNELSTDHFGELP